MTKRALPKADIATRPGLGSKVSETVLSRWNPDVKAAGESEETDAQISILDVIGQDFWGDGVTSKRIAGALRSIGDRDVTVLINSPGGDFFEGLAIYNMLREHQGAVTVKILGMAASAASVIAMAGDRIEIARAGFLMIHNTWVVAAGDRHSLKEVADWLEPFDAASVDIYAARSGVDAGDISSMLDRETWIGGASAVDQGFADALLSKDEVDAGAQQSAGGKVRAERTLDLICQKSGISRSAARQLRADLKGGQPGADLTGKHDAAVEAELAGLLKTVKSI